MSGAGWGGRRRNAGRKATGRNTVQVTLTLTREEAGRLRELARLGGLSASRLVASFMGLDVRPRDGD